MATKMEERFFALRETVAVLQHGSEETRQALADLRKDLAAERERTAALTKDVAEIKERMTRLEAVIERLEKAADRHAFGLPQIVTWGLSAAALAIALFGILRK